jgi:hypothetical protein
MAACRLAVVVMAAALAGCGDKVPESGAARKVGAVPKQTVDKATNDAAKALEQGAQRTRDGAQ